jgi:lactoylglutathione lyase
MLSPTLIFNQPSPNILPTMHLPLLTTVLALVLAALGQDGRRELGPDEYPPLATIGWNINHMALNVADLAASLHFYTEVLGMRHLFTYHGLATYKLAYVGYPSGGRNGTGYQTPAEMARDRANMQGLVELIWIAPNATAPSPRHPLASSRRANTLSHMGLVVPDLAAARERLLQAGAPIIKDVGERVDPFGPVAETFGLGLVPEGNEEWRRAAAAALDEAGARNFLFAEDPDGNVLEVRPLF